METGSQTLTTYYAKRIIGDTAAADRATALLQTGANIATNTWILDRTNRANTYGIKYLFDSTTNGTADKIEFYGGYQVDSADAPTAWVQLDTGDLYILGNVGIGHAPETYKLYVNGNSYLSDNNYFCINSGYANFGDTVQFSNTTSWKKGTMIVGANGSDKIIIGYLNSSTNGATVGAHASTCTAWAPLYLAGTQLYIRGSETTWAKWTNGCLSLFPTSNDYREGLRIHSYSSWSDITLCGNDNTGDNGTSANSWFIGNNNGNFYITRSGSTSGTAYLSCVSNAWSFKGALSILDGENLNIKAASSSNDTGDIVWFYGNGNEQARFWMGSGWTAKGAPSFREYKSDGTSLYNGVLPLGDGTGASGTWGISITGSAATLAPTSAAAYTTDTNGNFTHKRTTNTDYWALLSNAGSAKFQFYWETGNLTCTSVTASLTGNVTGNCSGSSGSCTGNAATATKATQDADGNTISSTYLKKSGGDMTGKIYSSATRILQWTTSDTDNNADGASWYGLGMFTPSGDHAWTCLSNYWGISLRARDNDHVKINGNVVLNAGNWSSYCAAASHTHSQYLTAHQSLANYVTLNGAQTISGAKTYTGMIYTSFKSGAAMCAYGSAQTTVANLLGELRYSNGATGSANLTAYTGTAGGTIAAGWYNFFYSPHRVGGLNGAANGDNHSYGSCILSGMTVATQLWYVRYYSNAIAESRRIWIAGNSVTGAVWNDYAEYRAAKENKPGQVLYELGNDTLAPTTERMQHFSGVSSDTWGFAQGETENAKTPIAVSGRVLVYTYRNRNEYKPGDCVCAAPDGTVDIMTRNEIIMYPDRIVGTVSCVPEYEDWGGGQHADRPPVKVNGRIWIKVK